MRSLSNTTAPLMMRRAEGCPCLYVHYMKNAVRDCRRVINQRGREIYFLFVSVVSWD